MKISSLFYLSRIEISEVCSIFILLLNKELKTSNMAQKITTSTFASLNETGIMSTMTDKMIDRQFELIEKHVEKGNLYMICRKVWHYLVTINNLIREYQSLRQRNNELREEIENLKRQKTIIRTVTTREEWIDNGQPAPFPTPNDGWMH